jgi:hypothetical protein
VGFFDALLGGKRKLKVPTSDRLFAMTTAQVTLETGHSIKHRNVAAIAFQSVATADFKEIMSEAEELLKSQAADTGTTVESSSDQYGYRWMVLRDNDFEDLVVAINMVSSTLETSGYGDRVLAAVFAFEDEGRPIYFIYNYKRGFFYPFVPAPGEQQRNNEREFQLKAQMQNELPIEEELERWFPLWGIPI